MEDMVLALGMRGRGRSSWRILNVEYETAFATTVSSTRRYGLLFWHLTRTLTVRQPDFSDTVDDPIATALRHAQEELREVSATNKARKSRLVAIAKDRLGYQEYLELRDTLDQNIFTLYTKLQKKDSPRNAKKKSHKKGAAAAAAAEEKLAATSAQALGMWPAALGLGPNEDNNLVVAKELQDMMETRKQWIETVGAVFEEKETEQPGRIYGLPERSVYEGIEEEVASLLARKEEPMYNGVGNGKGKVRAGLGDTDIG